MVFLLDVSTCSSILHHSETTYCNFCGGFLPPLFYQHQYLSVPSFLFRLFFFSFSHLFSGGFSIVCTLCSFFAGTYLCSLECVCCYCMV
jgi:hypothetical protein